MKLRITNSKYHSWYLCQISQQIMPLPILIKSKMATMFIADVTVLQRRHHPQNIPHISCREDQRLPTEGKIISKYCNTSKLKGRSSINTLPLPPAPPPLPSPMYHGGDMILRVRRSKLNAAHACTTLRYEPFWEVPISVSRSKRQIVIVPFPSLTISPSDKNDDVC